MTTREFVRDAIARAVAPARTADWPTALGVLNQWIGPRLDVLVRHQVESAHADRWRPWWRGQHVPGTWQLISVDAYRQACGATP